MKKFKNIVTATTCITLLALLILYCSSPTEPWVKHPRDYTWTVDTIVNPDPQAFQTMMSSIWGSSPEDVYVCGQTDGSPNIYHYDGEKWEAIDMRNHGLRNGERNKVFGFAENNIWIAGSLGYGEVGNSYKTSELLHYNGDRWQSYEFETRSELFDVWGTSSRDLWACGENGIVIHKNGNDWEIDTIKVNIEEGRRFFLRNIRKVDDILYIIGYKSEPQEYFFFQDRGDGRIQVDSFVIDYETYRWGMGLLYTSNDKRLFSTGFAGLFEYTNGEWVNKYPLNSGFYGIWECIEGEYLLAEFYGKIYLYASNEFEMIKEFSTNATMAELWGNKEECFIVANTGWRSYVFHGK